MNDLIKEKLSLLKELPGCYLMKNKENQVIYVGKAKKLVNRVSSYFLSFHTGKTAKLVSEIVDFDYIIVNSDKEAFLLEINLIHQYNPIYNILLKDSKAYPYIELHLGEYPYLSIARSMKNKKSKYFGPYSDSSSAYETLNLLNRLYPLRKCIHIPTKSCLYYHISQCLGPCINKIDPKEYKFYIDKITSFLNGNTHEALTEYKNKMLEASDKLNFEQANEYKNIYESIKHISSKQVIQMSNKINLDVFGFHTQDDYISISTLIYRNGILKLKVNKVLEYYGDPQSSFISYIEQYYEQNIIPKEVLVPSIEDINILSEVLNTKITSPLKGYKSNLLKMAGINAVELMNEKYMVSKTKDDTNTKVLEDLKKIIGIDNLYTIELIDNSHFNGSDAVSAVVVFKNCIPQKKMYRKYLINSNNTKDDLLSMEEIIYRRYSRKLKENDSFSDLLVVDGGLNQILAAKSSLDKLNINIPIIGLSKDDKHTTDSIVLSDGNKVYIKDNKELYFYLCKMQDEVHNFVISFHINKRSKHMFSSQLDDIEGLGDKRKQKLLDVYHDIESISKLSIDELSIYMPRSVAVNLFNKLNNK